MVALKDTWPIWIFFAVVPVAITFSLITFRRKMKAIEEMACRNGVTETRHRLFLAGFEGTWRGYRTRWSVRGGGKQPLRLIIDILAATPARLLIVRKQWWNPRLFSGPPIDIPAFPDLTVRGDDIMLATRILGDRELALRIQASLDSGLDFVELSTERVRVQRRVASSQEYVNRAQQAFELAGMLVQKLGLPPIG